MTHTTDPTARDPREDLLDALDFAFVVGPLGYGSREELLAAYDASRVPVSPPADQTGLRDRIAEELAARFTADGSISQGMRVIDPDDEGDLEPARRVRPLEAADAVLAVLPPPADRAAVLCEAADIAEDVAESLRKHHEFERSTGALDVMTELRRVAAEEQPTEPWLTDSARIGRALIWSWSDVGKGAFREGYRAAQAEARALLGGERSTDQQRPVVGEQPDTQEAP